MTTSFSVAKPGPRLGLAAAGCLAMVLLAGPVRAEDANPVLAKVNGSEIRKSDVALAEEELGPSLAQMDAATKDENVLAFLIDMKIVSKAAEDKKVQDSDDFKRRMTFTRSRLLMDNLLASEGKAATTDDAMKKVREEFRRSPASRKSMPATSVETEDRPRAEDELKKGADFAELAKKKSMIPAPPRRRPRLLQRDQMVPEFSAAAFALEPGKVSDPVKTQFGWHVIKVEEKRNRRPDFDRQEPDRNLCDAQGAGRLRGEAARGRQDRALGQAGRDRGQDGRKA
jgi:peptidyl-prolyl cis-trans isomerase C